MKSQGCFIEMNLKKKHIFIVILAVFIATVSCFKRKTEAERKDLIPQEKMADILTDLYIADGLLILPLVHHWYESEDSIAAYRDVIESHGETKEDFDRSIRFYFIKKPKQLMKIYEQVLARLSEMESRYDQETARLQAQVGKMWKGKETISSVASDTTEFDIKFDFWNIYYLSFTATVMPGDQSVNPRPVIYTCHPDSAMTGTRHYVNTLEYIKDGLPHRYVYQINDPDKTRLRLRGDLFVEDNDPDVQYFLIEEISLNY